MLAKQTRTVMFHAPTSSTNLFINSAIEPVPLSEAYFVRSNWVGCWWLSWTWCEVMYSVAPCGVMSCGCLSARWTGGSLVVVAVWCSGGNVWRGGFCKPLMSFVRSIRFPGLNSCSLGSYVYPELSLADAWTSVVQSVSGMSCFLLAASAVGGVFVAWPVPCLASCVHLCKR